MALRIVGLFCEDIREEKSGQLTLVGTLPDNVNVAQRPIPIEGKRVGDLVPKLGLYVRIYFDPDDEPKPMKVKLVFPDSQRSDIDLGSIGEDVITTSKNQARANQLPFAGIVHHALLQGLTMSGAGQMIAVVESEEVRHTCAVLNFKVPPTASEPPASQSQPAS